MKSLSWEDWAACLDRAPELFHPTTRAGELIAIAICRTCPVRAECLDYTMAVEDGYTTNGRHGIFGGLTPGERYARAPQSPPAVDGERASGDVTP